MRTLPAPKTVAIVPANQAAIARPRVRRASDEITKSVMASRILAIVPPQSIARDLRVELANIEGAAAEYQHWCDAMVSSITWLAEAIEEQDMEGLEKALGFLEAGVKVSGPALAKMAALAVAIRERMPQVEGSKIVVRKKAGTR